MNFEQELLIEFGLDFLHGTSSELVPGILERGLVPIGAGQTIWSQEPSRPGRVYLANPDIGEDLAWRSAERAAEEFGGQPDLVLVTLDPEDATRLEADEDALKEYSSVRGFRKYYPREVDPELQKDVRRLPAWYLSLVLFGSMAYRGTIAPGKISALGWEDLNPEAHPFWRLDPFVLDAIEALARLTPYLHKRGESAV